MNKKLLYLSIFITAIFLATSIYLGTIENPTDIQKQLSTTANTVTLAGATAIFGLLKDEDGKDDEDRNTN